MSMSSFNQKTSLSTMDRPHLVLYGITCIGIMTEDASSLAEGMNMECSAMIEKSMELLIKSSSWMVPSSSWKVVIPIWALVRIGISLDLDMKLPVECVCCSAERLDLHSTH